MNNTIALTIDGHLCEGDPNDTILDVARKHDIYIPTLCHLEGLPSIGACRLCVVQLEGSPKLLPSCTTQITAGMVVHTKTEKLVKYRRQILELLFAGRNHFCMFCSQSGDCVLQKLAIEYGMDSVRYPFLYTDFKNDASSPHMQLDHNRCILCLRCIRVCAEKVGAHTLDLCHRGWEARVAVDLGVNLGESDTCVQCGACAQVCPTGTITLRQFAYRGRTTDCDAVVKSICPMCSVGCQINAYVRTGSVVLVRGVLGDSPDGGQLCHRGRWWLPESTERERVTEPMIRNGASFRKASWDEALWLVARKLRESLAGKRAGAILSEYATNQELTLYGGFFRQALGMEYVDCFRGDSLRGFKNGFKHFADQGCRPFTTASNILDSDAVIVLNANPQDEAPVVASYIRVAAINRKAPLVCVSSGVAPFKGICDVEHRLAPEEFPDFVLAIIRAMDGQAPTGPHAQTVAAIRDILAKAKKPIFVLGSLLAHQWPAVTYAVNLAIKLKAFRGKDIAVVPMIRMGNGLGTMGTVLSDTPWLRQVDLDFLFVQLMGLVPVNSASLEPMSKVKFVVLQTPYKLHPYINLADVLLPAQAWNERDGHFFTLEGDRQAVNMIVPPPPGLLEHDTLLRDLAAKLGVNFEPAESSATTDLYKAQLAPDMVEPAPYPSEV
ncbi:hypothetical protein JCM15519_37630 [Fundidesulfovibrio butyratiphilus]